jgi:hypothetical protein
MLDKLETNRGARIFVSIILGLGIASLFRLTCKEGSCYVVKGPGMNDVDKHVYKVDEDGCYKYSSHKTPCGGEHRRSFDDSVEKPQ